MEDKKKKKPIDEKDSQKPEEESQEEHNIVLTPEDLDNLLEELKSKYNLGDENIKIVKIERKKPPLKIMILSLLLSFLFDFLLVIALNGYLDYTAYNILKLLLFSIVFSTAEYLFREVLMRFFPKLMFYSFGTILIPISIAALALAWWISDLQGNDSLIPFFIIFLVVRLIMNVLLIRRNRDKMFKQIRGGKNEK